MEYNVINFHLTDSCNYQCKFCFVDKQKRQLSLEKSKKIVLKVKRYFQHINKKGRINLAGGEPLCYPYIQDLIDFIYNEGIEVSIITNASLLKTDFILNNKDKLSTIGISVDSLNPNTNIILGRCTYSNNTLDINNLKSLCKQIKDNNIKLKINHCVCKLNLNEDIRSFVEEVQPDRFKIFQVVPDNLFSFQNRISTEEFKNYLEKYKGINFIEEDNDFMREHYLIVDSEGKLSKDNSHKHGISILDSTEIKDLI